MIEIKHLKCLSAVKAMSGVRQLTPAAFPGNHCPMHTALSLGARIKGISTLVIGTAECGYYSRNVPLASPYGEEGLHWTYILDSREVVFGFREGLIKAVEEMDRAGAKVILLLATCIPELIGEDIESICCEMQPKVNAVLVQLPLGNFKCGSYQPGYWKTLLALGKLIEKVKEKTKTVNILGRSISEAHLPTPQLITLLEQFGIPLRFLAPDSSLDDFISAGDAQVNLVLSPFLNPLAERMEQEHKIPFISLHDIYSVMEIQEAYFRLEQYLGIHIGSESACQFKQAEELQRKAAVKLKGTSYISANIGALQPLPLSAYLSALGMSPIMIHMEDFYPTDRQWKERLAVQGENPIICLMLNEQADRPLIEALCPDLVLGDWGGRNQLQPPSVPLLDLYGQAGYERTITLLERLINQLPLGKGGGKDGTL